MAIVRKLYVIRKSSHRFVRICLQLNSGTGVHKSAHIRATKFCTVEGKAIPLQVWTGPEGSRSLMLPKFKTVGT